MTQTAVEYLFEKLWDCPKDKLTWFTIIEQAKEMEKQQKGFSEEEVYKLICNMPNFFNMTIPEQIEARDQWYREQLKSKK